MRRAIRRAWRSSPYSKRMRASSSGAREFTRSAAVRPRVGSNRISRLSSRVNEKPRSDSSSWYDDNPRSRSTATARDTPASAASCTMSRKLPCRSTTRSPNRARRRPARRIASGSRSTPNRRVSAGPPSRIRSACPPIPIVPSTTHPPRRGRKRNATSSIRTGRCACPSRSATLDTLRRQPRAELVEPAARITLEVGPALRIPHFEHLLHADDQHVLRESRALAIVRRDLNASLRIEQHVLPERQVRIAELARVGIETGQRDDTRLQLFPRLERVDVEALPVRHDHELVAPAVRECFAKARRDAEAALCVHRVTVVPTKHCPLPAGVRNPCLNAHSLHFMGFHPTGWLS